MGKRPSRMNAHFFFILTLLATIVFVFGQTALSQDVRGVTDTTVKIGIIADMTGPIASVTGILAPATRNCARYLNEKGGVHGRRIEVIAEDDHYSIPVGIAAFKKLVFRDKAFAVMGPYHTASIKALFGQVDKYKIPDIAAVPQPSMVNPVKRYLFATGEFYDDDIGVLFNYIMSELKPQDPKIAFCTFDGESGKEVHDSVKKWARFFHYKPSIPKVIIPLGAMEASSQVLTIKRKKITHILMHHSVSGASLLLRELKKFGLNTPVFADVLSCSEDTVKLAGSASKNYTGAHGFSSWYDDNPAMKKVREVTLKYHPGTETPWRSKYYTVGWLGMTLLHEGMKRAGRDLTPESCVQGLESIKDFDTQGLCGPVTFSPNDHKGFSTCKLFKADLKSGKLVPITDWTNPPAL